LTCRLNGVLNFFLYQCKLHFLSREGNYQLMKKSFCFLCFIIRVSRPSQSKCYKQKIFCIKSKQQPVLGY
jgi:hypothetical protein